MTGTGLSQSLWNMNQNQDYMPLEESEAEEDRVSGAGSKPEDAAGAAGTRLEARETTRALGICFICGTLMISATVAAIYFLGTFGNTRSFPAHPGNSGNAGRNGDPSRYPADFLRDVVPIPCHSHNDYWRSEPLFSAIRAGCIGVEADVWHFDNDDDDEEDLLVGHDTAALTANRTFRSLYVDPLVGVLTLMNPQTPFYHETRRGVFDVDPEQTLVLLVDVKTDGAATWPRVLEQLEPLRSRGWLTRYEDGVVTRGPVTVVGTGNTPFGLLTQNSTYRDAFFDAPLESLGEEDEGGTSTSRGRKSADDNYDHTNSFYASTSFRDVIGPVSRGALSEDQLRMIRGQISGAHRRGLKARYWETPSWPVGTRNKLWRILVEEGADILNVDDLYAASQSVW